MRRCGLRPCLRISAGRRSEQCGSGAKDDDRLRIATPARWHASHTILAAIRVPPLAILCEITMEGSLRTLTGHVDAYAEIVLFADREFRKKQSDCGFADFRAGPWRDGNWGAGYRRSDGP